MRNSVAGEGGNRPSTRAYLLQLVDKNLLVEILNAFTNVTGLTANIVDTEGRSIFSKADAQINCSFCQLIWKLEKQKGVQRCKGAYARAGKQAALFNEPYIFRCPGGLVEWAAPIIVDGEHLGSVICGQVLMWEPEEFFWIELEEMNRVLTDDFEPLFKAAKELQVVSGEKVQSAASLLSIMANYIELQQALLNDEIATRKSLEEKLNSQSLNYYIEKEKSLVGKIRLGDLDECRRIFKVMLADILADTVQSNLAVVRARVFELVVVVSRASVEAGVNSERPMGINAAFMQELGTCYSTEEINTAALKVLDRNLTLEEIADSVYLSPYYVSRIFKESQSITVMDYVTRVKLDEAKKMLGNTRYKIDEIAVRLGYSDASYFSKVFKKNEGMTPTQFRQSR